MKLPSQTISEALCPREDGPGRQTSGTSFLKDQSCPVALSRIGAGLLPPTRMRHLLWRPLLSTPACSWRCRHHKTLHSQLDGAPQPQTPHQGSTHT